MTSGPYTSPGVVVERVPPRAQQLPHSGVPVFVLGLGPIDPALELEPVLGLANLTARFGAEFRESQGGRALHGYFVNRGGPCFVFSCSPGEDGLSAALARSEALDEVDLVCAPGMTSLPEHLAILAHCARMGERFALLDAPPSPDKAGVEGWLVAAAHARSLHTSGLGKWGSLFFPWLRVAGGGEGTGTLVVAPPSGHLAGLMSYLDRDQGPHVSPANHELEGALDVTTLLTDGGEDGLWLNPLRPRRGRGIVLWGGRTLTGGTDPIWIDTRRVLLLVTRHTRILLEQLTFEANDITLWMRVHRSLEDYLGHLFRMGALAGRTAREAYFIKCDDTNNPMDVRKRGELTVEVGVAPGKPMEYIVLRIQRDAHQVTVVPIPGGGA